MATVLLVGLAASSCGNERNETDIRDTLDRQVCTGEDVGPGFNHQTSGDFSLTNLAGMTLGHESERLAAFKKAGVVGGHFAFWKQVAGHPPFDPPFDVVCQVLEFDSDASAEGFVAGDAGTLVSAMVAMLPESYTTTEAAAAQPAGARAFSLVGESDTGRLSVGASALASGRYVRSVYVGGLEGSGELAEAQRIQENMAARLK